MLHHIRVAPILHMPYFSFETEDDAASQAKQLRGATVCARGGAYTARYGVDPESDKFAKIAEIVARLETTDGLAAHHRYDHQGGLETI